MITIYKLQKIGGIPWELITNSYLSPSAKVLYAALEAMQSEKNGSPASVVEISTRIGSDCELVEGCLKELIKYGYVAYELDVKLDFHSKHTLVLSRRDPTRRKVYLMRNAESNKYKIGYSINPEARAIQIGNPVNEITIIYTIYGGRAEEKQLHKQFQKNRIRGEWFEFTDDLVQDVIQKMKDIEQK